MGKKSHNEQKKSEGQAVAPAHSPTQDQEETLRQKYAQEEVQNPAESLPASLAKAQQEVKAFCALEVIIDAEKIITDSTPLVEKLVRMRFLTERFSEVLGERKEEMIKAAATAEAVVNIKLADALTSFRDRLAEGQPGFKREVSPVNALITHACTEAWRLHTTKGVEIEGGAMAGVLNNLIYNAELQKDTAAIQKYNAVILGIDKHLTDSNSRLAFYRAAGNLKYPAGDRFVDRLGLLKKAAELAVPGSMEEYINHCHITECLFMEFKRAFDSELTKLQRMDWKQAQKAFYQISLPYQREVREHLKPILQPLAAIVQPDPGMPRIHMSIVMSLEMLAYHNALSSAQPGALEREIENRKDMQQFLTALEKSGTTHLCQGIIVKEGKYSKVENAPITEVMAYNSKQLAALNTVQQERTKAKAAFAEQTEKANRNAAALIAEELEHYTLQDEQEATRQAKEAEKHAARRAQSAVDRAKHQELQEVAKATRQAQEAEQEIIRSAQSKVDAANHQDRLALQEARRARKKEKHQKQREEKALTSHEAPLQEQPGAVEIKSQAQSIAEEAKPQPSQPQQSPARPPQKKLKYSPEEDAYVKALRYVAQGDIQQARERYGRLRVIASNKQPKAYKWMVAAHWGEGCACIYEANRQSNEEGKFPVKFGFYLEAAMYQQKALEAMVEWAGQETSPTLETLGEMHLRAKGIKKALDNITESLQASYEWLGKRQAYVAGKKDAIEKMGAIHGMGLAFWAGGEQQELGGIANTLTVCEEVRKNTTKITAAAAYLLDSLGKAPKEGVIPFEAGKLTTLLGGGEAEVKRPASISHRARIEQERMGNGGTKAKPDTSQTPKPRVTHAERLNRGKGSVVSAVPAV